MEKMSEITNATVASLNKAVDDKNPDDIQKVLKSIVDIAEGSKLEQESLGNAGACEALYRVLVAQIHIPEVCEAALWALSRMCRREQDQYLSACVYNITRFGDTGICPQIVHVMRLNMQHPGVVAASLRAIANMSSMTQSNKTKLREAGCCECIVQGLRLHLNDPFVVEQGCWVMTFLACDHPENKVRLGKVGACEIVVTAISEHITMPAVLCRVLGAVAFLAKSNDVNRDRLLELKACDESVKCLHRYPHDKSVLQVVCHVLLYLYYCDRPEKVDMLKESGALDGRGWVVDMPYEAAVAAWKPDDVVQDLKRSRGSDGAFCSFIICT